ncbi:unnamed protein product [Porites lobata]|uniref:Uncharacterized protein n=1 Tax=Porites lobata TaxID=104759 RepID=A0ABN8QCD7_9CNID|nr:unnamed protein product [Porites lobata]
MAQLASLILTTGALPAFEQPGHVAVPVKFHCRVTAPPYAYTRPLALIDTLTRQRNLSTRRSWYHGRQPEVFLQHDNHCACQDVLELRSPGHGLQNASSQVETRGSNLGFFEEYSLFKSRNSSSEILFSS